MTGTLHILLPPSEAKRAGGSRTAKVGRFDVTLGAVRREVTAALGEFVGTANPQVLERTLHARTALLDRAVEAVADLVAGREPLLPAWQRYNGVVWAHLEAASLTPAQRRRILVPSGLYGITTAQDPIGDYRLRMNVALAPLGTLAAFWRPLLAPVLAPYVRGATVVDMLPREHQAALDFETLQATCRLARVCFVGADGAAAVGHGAKAVKGVLARRVLLEGLDVLDSFRWEGWRAERSGDVSLVIAPRIDAPGASRTRTL